VNEFCFGDREGDAHVSALLGYGGKQTLKAAYVSPIRWGGHHDGEVVDVGDHEASGY